MSWFWRTPSILARSLMREAAPAGTASQIAISAATARLRSFVQVTFGLPAAASLPDAADLLMRAPCQPAGLCQRLDISILFLAKRGILHAPAGQGLPGAADIAGWFNRLLTTTARPLPADQGLLMRIYGPNGTSMVGTAAPARRTGTGTFSLDQAEESRPSKSTSSLRTIGGIDALIALQGVEDPTERRRRAVKRGRMALDALDELKLGLLAGTLDTATLARLKTAVTDLGGDSGDPGLDGVLAEIGLRVEVELAKFGPPKAGPNRAK